MLNQFIHKIFHFLSSRKIQRKLRATNTCLFVEAFPNPVFWLSRERVYQGCNQVFADLIGFKKPSDIIGLKDKDLPFSLETLAKREEIFEEIITSKRSVSLLYDCIIGPKDKTVWAQKRFTPLKDKNENIIGIFGTVVDISEHVYRREKIEGHLERKNIISNFVEDLNKTSILSTQCVSLTERMITILKETSGSDLAIWVRADAPSVDEFVYFATDRFDSLELFKEKEAFLKNNISYGYLDSMSLNSLKEIYPDITSILFYRLHSKVFPIYDDLILLVNPNDEKIKDGSTRLVLSHHIINYFHLHKFLTDSTHQKA